MGVWPSVGRLPFFATLVKTNSYLRRRFEKCNLQVSVSGPYMWVANCVYSGTTEHMEKFAQYSYGFSPRGRYGKNQSLYRGLF